MGPVGLFDVWSSIVALCLLALFGEGVLLLHVLFVTRQAVWPYLLLAVLPLGVSVWSFNVLQEAWNASEVVSIRFASLRGIHFSPSAYHALLAPLVHATFLCQVQAIMSITVFVAMLFLQVKFLPRVYQPPIWVRVKKGLRTGEMLVTPLCPL